MTEQPEPQAQDDQPERPVRTIVDEVRVVTLVTHDRTVGWTGRPLTVAEEFDGLLRFLVSRTAHWVVGLDETDAVVVVADPAKNVFAVLTGKAEVSNHRGTIDRIWSAPAAAFFEGKDDPDIAVVEFQTSSGEWWDAPSGSIGRALTMIRAAVGGDVGDQAGSVTPR